MVTDEMVEKAAEAYWMQVYGRHRKANKWPDDVFGSSQGLFRDGCRAALEAALSAAEPKPAPSVGVKAEKTTCKNCGGNLNSWFTANKVNSVAVDGRLKSSEISCDFVLGCDECSETLRVVPADKIASQINAALSAQVQDVATHRHKKRGTEYVLIGVGKIQVENWCEFTTEVNHTEGREYAFVGKAVDMREVAIYRSVDDCSLWVRPIEEFNDGRFQPLPAAPAKQEGSESKPVHNQSVENGESGDE